MKPSAESEGSSGRQRAEGGEEDDRAGAAGDERRQPHAEKMDEKESPITIVYCRLTESVRMPMSAEGTHAVLSPTDFDHASPHDLEPVAAQTRPTAEKPVESRKWRRCMVRACVPVCVRCSMR